MTQLGTTFNTRVTCIPGRCLSYLLELMPGGPPLIDELGQWYPDFITSLSTPPLYRVL